MPRSSSTFTLVTDAAAARARFADLVAREPEALSVIASVTEGLVADPSRYAGPRWWAVTDASGEVVGAVMHTPPHPVHIALATVDEARDLAALLADQGVALPGVGGQRGPAEAFAAEWVARTGATSRVAMEVGRYDLPARPHVPFVVSGSFRLADGTDIEPSTSGTSSSSTRSRARVGSSRRSTDTSRTGGSVSGRTPGARCRWRTPPRQRRGHPHLGRVDPAGGARARLRERRRGSPQCRPSRRGRGLHALHRPRQPHVERHLRGDGLPPRR